VIIIIIQSKDKYFVWVPSSCITSYKNIMLTSVVYFLEFCDRIKFGRMALGCPSRDWRTRQ